MYTEIFFFIEGDTIKDMFKDPVCNMMVNEESAKNISQVGDKKIFLCSAACKNEFDKNPKKYGY